MLETTLFAMLLKMCIVTLLAITTIYTGYKAFHHADYKNNRFVIWLVYHIISIILFLNQL